MTLSCMVRIKFIDISAGTKKLLKNSIYHRLRGLWTAVFAALKAFATVTSIPWKNDY